MILLTDFRTNYWPWCKWPQKWKRLKSVITLLTSIEYNFVLFLKYSIGLMKLCSLNSLSKTLTLKCIIQIQSEIITNSECDCLFWNLATFNYIVEKGANASKFSQHYCTWIIYKTLSWILLLSILVVELQCLLFLLLADVAFNSS